jgi:hypothetical protein
MSGRIVSIKLKECGSRCPYYKGYETDLHRNICGEYCAKEDTFISSEDRKTKFPKWCRLKKNE